MPREHSPIRRIILVIVWPLLMLFADLALRARIIATFSFFDWNCYLASFFLIASLWSLFCHFLKKQKKYRYLLLIIATSGLQIITIGLGYGLYFANGDLPDLFLLSFIRCETENAAIMFRDSTTWLHYLGAILGTALLAFGTHISVKKFTPPQTRRPIYLTAITACVTLWFSWTYTYSQGQTYLPLTRTPLIIGVYLQNEIKGINPKPILLPERQAHTIATTLPQPPINVLLILNESLRRNRLSLYGHDRKTTPFIDQLAATSPQQFFRFDHTYTNSTTTLLSVPSILNGIAPYQPIAQKITAPNIWQWAKAAQMHSFYHSSHHLDWLGLGKFITTPPPDHTWDMRQENLPHYRDMGCDDHITIARSIAHLNARAQNPQPFLGVIHLNTNHYPYNTAAPYQKWQGSPSDLYDNSILEVDTHTQRIIDALKANNQFANTLIIFASDHGEAFNEHGYTAHFYCHFTETITVPLWLLLPEQITKSRDLQALRENLTRNTQNLDILPTILDAIGAWDHPELTSHTRSMLGSSLFRPIDANRPILITNTDEIMPSVIGLSSVIGPMHYMLRTSGKTPLEDLYNIDSDPQERQNLWPNLPPIEREAFRQAFRPYPVSAGMIDKAFPQKQ